MWEIEDSEGAYLGYDNNRFFYLFLWRETFVETRCICHLGVLCIDKFLK